MRGPRGRDVPAITIEGQKGDQGERGPPGRDGRPCEILELLSGPRGRTGYQVSLILSFCLSLSLSSQIGVIMFAVSSGSTRAQR